LLKPKPKLNKTAKTPSHSKVKTVHNNVRPITAFSYGRDSVVFSVGLCDTGWRFALIFVQHTRYIFPPALQQLNVFIVQVLRLTKAAMD